MKKKDILFLLILFLLNACSGKTSSFEMDEDSTIGETFKRIDLIGNLKDCGKPLLLSDLVDSVEYVKLETTNSILVGEIKQLKRTNLFVFIYSRRQNHIMMFDKFGKFIRKIGRIGQGPGEMSNIQSFTVNENLAFIYPLSRRASFMVYDIHSNNFVKELSLKYPVSVNDKIDIMGDCLIYYPGIVYLPNNKEVFISACVINKDGHIVREQVPEIAAEARKIDMAINPDISWNYQRKSNIYSLMNDTIYGITYDSIFPRYYLALGKYKLPPEKYNFCNNLDLGDFILIKDACETKDYLFLSFWFKCKMWFSRYDKKKDKIDSWEQEPFDVRYWMIHDAPGITNDIDGSQSFTSLKNVGENCFYFAITPDNLDEVRRNVTEAKVKFPKKQAELLKLLDEMGEDDNPIIAFYKLKD
ncbi:6-bladed beta-propeller [Bacteroides fragilis]|nr:6-bladed beta-propeller [Bacteroides fragilis]MCE9476313.1 6-bladed beta-propeller [Bacteroides fragilis]